MNPPFSAMANVTGASGRRLPPHRLGALRVSLPVAAGDDHRRGLWPRPARLARGFRPLAGGWDRGVLGGDRWLGLCAPWHDVSDAADGDRQGALPPIPPAFRPRRAWRRMSRHCSAGLPAHVPPRLPSICRSRRAFIACGRALGPGLSRSRPPRLPLRAGVAQASRMPSNSPMRPSTLEPPDAARLSDAIYEEYGCNRSGFPAPCRIRPSWCNPPPWPRSRRRARPIGQSCLLTSAAAVRRAAWRR
jgi:hypothetical protein